MSKIPITGFDGDPDKSLLFQNILGKPIYLINKTLTEISFFLSYYPSLMNVQLEFKFNYPFL